MSDVQEGDVAAMMAAWEASQPAPAPSPPPGPEPEPEPEPEPLDLTPTHALWRADGTVEIVSLNGFDPDSPDLTPLPVGFDWSTWRPAPDTRTFVFDLGPMKVRLQKQIDEDAEKARQRYITPGAGQAITYIRKETEARARTADPQAATPLLEAEAAAIGITVDQLADEVIVAADQWLTVGSLIEALRRGAKEAVAAAETAEAALAASEVAWP